jgi:hypothetical protein
MIMRWPGILSGGTALAFMRRSFRDATQRSGG